MIVVSNTTPLISLACIDKLEILEALFQEIIIPEAVYNEIKANEGFGYKEIDSEFIKVQPVKGKIYRDLLLNQLDLGEAETIILATELKADFVIVDENAGYKIAKSSGLSVIRTLSVLLKAKERGIVNELKPLLDKMISNGQWYSKKVYENFLERIGEL